MILCLFFGGLGADTITWGFGAMTGGSGYLGSQSLQRLLATNCQRQAIRDKRITSCVDAPLLFYLS